MYKKNKTKKSIQQMNERSRYFCLKNQISAAANFQFNINSYTDLHTVAWLSLDIFYLVKIRVREKRLFGFIFIYLLFVFHLVQLKAEKMRYFTFILKRHYVLTYQITSSNAHWISVSTWFFSKLFLCFQTTKKSQFSDCDWHYKKEVKEKALTNRQIICIKHNGRSFLVFHPLMGSLVRLQNAVSICLFANIFYLYLFCIFSKLCK